MEDLKIFCEIIEKNLLIEGTFSVPRNENTEHQKGKITLMEIGGEIKYQLELFTQKQAFHYNYSSKEMAKELENLLLNKFRQFSFNTNEYSYSLKFSKKDKLLHNRKKLTNAISNAPKNHNRKKEYLLQEGEFIPPLVDLGVFTKEGKVVNSMQDKFRQINRFVEFVEDTIRHKNPESLNILDFGCGKSYLTFILYYYLNFVKKIPTTITGLDLKEDVINKCNEIAKGYGYDKLKFITGDVALFKDSNDIDMVITLHACDTATDFALYHAVKMNANIILSVPCCQHEINGQIGENKNTLFTRYGLVKERMSALATDSIRGNLLQLCGYSTQLLEFVDISHSPKNILIRAVKGGNTADKSQLTKEIEDFCNLYGVNPTLKTLLESELIN